VSSWTFPKSSRLLNSAQFQRIFQKAAVKVSHQHLLILANNNDCGYPRLGLVVGKKHCRLAVGRNRLKRHIRETFRHWQHHLGSIDAIVLPRSGTNQLTDKDLHLLLEQQWQRLAKRSREHNQSQQS
jgi:ribonuclease P protein component